MHSRLQRRVDQLKYVLLGNASLSAWASVFIELFAVRRSVTVTLRFKTLLGVTMSFATFTESREDQRASPALCKSSTN